MYIADGQLQRSESWGHTDEAIRQIRRRFARSSYGDARAGCGALPPCDALHEVLQFGVSDDGEVDGRDARYPDGAGNHEAGVLHNVS